MQYSPEQLAAIASRRQNLLVAAAAGSGKTSVLVERIIRRICDPKEMMSVDRLLVVTFTNAAASEMRSRVADALNNVLTGSNADKNLCRHIQRQITLLNAAAISTLHSFCQSLLRQYFYQIDLDPNFRVANETEIELLKNDILEEMLEEEYAQADCDLLLLADYCGGEGDNGALAGLVLKVYEFSRSHPWPDEWIKKLISSFDIPPEADFDQTDWVILLKDKIRLDLDMSRLELAALLEEALTYGNPGPYAETFAADMRLLDSLLSACQSDFMQLKEAFNKHKFPRLPSAGKEIDEQIKKTFQKKRDLIKRRVKLIEERYFTRSAKELVEDLKLAAPVVSALAKVVRSFAELFGRAKIAKGLVDFSDLEHLALRILRSDSSVPMISVPSAAALELREKYEEIMIDEYQDINRLQEEIIQLLVSPEKPGLFMVGDVKQSIYRFRLAEPELFLQKYQAYRNSPKTLDQNGVVQETERRIDLNQNFRSLPGIIHGVNFIFGSLMTKRTGEIEYGKDEQLNTGADYSPPDNFQGKILDGSIELCLIDPDQTAKPDDTNAAENSLQNEGQNDFDKTDLNENEEQERPDDDAETEEELSRFEQESLLIVQKIKELTASGYSIYDKKTKSYRALRFRDIVILLRSPKRKSAIILDMLREKDIPAYAELDSGYFAETEVSIMLSLLNIIDNPRQDIHLAAALRSPLVGLDAEALAKIRLNNPEGDLWEALLSCADTAKNNNIEKDETIDKINLFLKRHTNWRSLSRRKAVGKLIHAIYQETGFYDYAGGMPGGALRQANLRALYERAAQYERTNFRGLFRFLKFIDKLKEKGSDLALAKALGEGENVVRIMSIHKSKGLEFPVVIVADLGKNFNLKDANSLMLCHKELGVGPYVALTEERLRYPTPARWAISHKIEQETKAEELRILYVALTRAREKLILVGSTKKLAQKCQTWRMSAKNACLSLPLKEAQILKAKSYLDMLGPALSRHPDGKKLREYGSLAKDDFPFLENASSFSINIYPAESFTTKEKSSKEFDEIWTAVENGQPLPGADTSWVGDILNWRYPYLHTIGKPAKLTITEIKRRLDFSQDNETLPAEYLHKDFSPAAAPFSRPKFLQEKSGLTRIEYGTLIHTLMQHLNLQGDLSLPGIAAQAELLVKKEFLLPSQLEGMDYKAIAAFFAGGLGQRLIKAAKVWRELPFSLTLSAEAFYPDLKSSGEQVFVQGVIDCIFAEGDQVVLIDYKTDLAASQEDLTNKYSAQLSMYSLAVESILKLEVKEEYLYSFALSEAILLKGIG